MDLLDEDLAIGEQLERRRQAAAAAWNLGPDDVVVVAAGSPVPVPGRGDRTYPYKSHSEFFYLTDRDDAGAVLTFDPEAGWTEFAVPMTPAQRLYGPVPPERELPAASAHATIDELTPWLEARKGKRVAWLGAAAPEGDADAAATSEARIALNAVRRPKDEVELYRMRRAEEVTRLGFAAVTELIEPDVTERALQVELEAIFSRNGGDALAFDTIVASGPNAAVLHFFPGQRTLRSGELVLIDAGAEYRGYASDVTRTYAVDGELNGIRRALYDAVDEARRAAVARCWHGTEYRDVHREASLVIGAHLVELGLLRGEPESLFEAGAIALFFPHGIGHMVGLGVRDAGGESPRDLEAHPGYPHMRFQLPLQRGFVVTIEPGIYFVRGILDDPEARRQHRDAVDWDQVDELQELGGIRLEDNVLVTDAEPEIITAGIPLVP